MWCGLPNLSRINDWQDRVVFNSCNEGYVKSLKPSVFANRPPKTTRDLFLNPEPEVRLHAVWFSSLKPKYSRHKNNANRRLSIVFHGNQNSVADWGMIAADINLRGYDVLMPEYRSYGKCRGPMSEQALIEDARRWYDFVIKLGYQPENIILHGISIGCAFAAQLAAQVEIDRLILEMPFDCLLTVAQHHVGKWVSLVESFGLKYHFDNVGCVSLWKCNEVFAIHAIDDCIIPFHAFETLSKEIKKFHHLGKFKYNEFVMGCGGGHNVRRVESLWRQFFQTVYS